MDKTFQMVEAVIDGVMPLLMARFGETAQESVPGGSGKKTRSAHQTGQTRTPKEVAEEACYRDAGGSLYMPGACFARLLREAGSAHKIKGSRKSVKFVVPAAVLILDDQVPLFALDRETRLNDYEVDSRSAVIPSTKGRVMVHRPRIEKWCARFGLRINTGILSVELVRQLLVEGGQQIGIGAFRPEKGGPFGLFDVTAWDCIDARKKKD